MRKSLFCGAALAALAVASTAQADDANVTSGLQLKISGRIGFLAGLSLTDNGTEKFDRDYDFASGARMQFDIKNVTDSGLEYGARIRFNNVNRRQDVTVDRTYVYVKGDFGTVTFGDAPYIAEDIGVVYAHQTLATKFGLDTDWADGFRSSANTFGGSDRFFAVAAYDTIGGLSNKDTKIKYTSPNLAGFSFGVDFTPVVGGNGHAGNGGRNDLFNDSSTLYENVIGGGVDYSQSFDGTAVRLAATAYNGNGVSGNHDFEAYTLGGQVGFANAFWASVNWTHFSSMYQTDKAIDSIVGDLSYTTGPWLASVGYAYTTAEKGNGLDSSFTDGQDLKTNHSVIGTLVYNLAPGLNLFSELRYEKNEFRVGKDFETSALTAGTVLTF
ncbi:porin [Inquilinus sp. NPDC058860]|uniref:porin n=1 Tax=Inquilinus sp. NPDC058860 TaxID=3346652 RepID=UPI00368C968D